MTWMVSEGGGIAGDPKHDSRDRFTLQAVKGRINAMQESKWFVWRIPENASGKRTKIGDGTGRPAQSDISSRNLQKRERRNAGGRVWEAQPLTRFRTKMGPGRRDQGSHRVPRSRPHTRAHVRSLLKDEPRMNRNLKEVFKRKGKSWNE